MVQYKLSDISKFFTKDILEKAFKIRTNSDDTVETVQLGRAAPPGEGLLSVVYRLTVTGKKHKASFILKCLSKDEVLLKSTNSNIFFEREILFFSKVLPAMVEVEKLLGSTEKIQSKIPICYYTYMDGRDDFLLLEDLAERDCRPISPKSTDDINLTLKSLAHFHAVSMAFRMKEPNAFEKLAHKIKEVYYSEDRRSWYTNYLNRALALNKEALASDATDLYQKFDGITSGDVYGRLIELANTRSAHVVINHGDAWNANFLASKDHAVMIDFQLIRCVSPAADIVYILLICSDTNKIKENFMTGLKVYHDALTYHLKDLGVDATNFSMETLMEEIREHGKLGVMLTFTSIPLLGSTRCDNLQSFASKTDADKIPLEELWHLTPLDSDFKLRLINTLHTAIDFNII